MILKVIEADSFFIDNILFPKGINTISYGNITNIKFIGLRFD